LRVEESELGVRVRVLLRRGDKEIITSALLNTGFESEELDLVLPSQLADELGLRSELGEFVRLDTAGGPLECAFVEQALELKLLLEDREGPELTCNAIVSPYEREVLLSDAVIEALGIQIISAKSGKWRLKDDPPGLERSSVSPA